MISEEGDLRGFVVIVMQVLFRYHMGERYFNFKAFWHGLLFFLFIRFLFFFNQDTSSASDYPFHLMDVALILYVILGLWQLMQHSRLEAKGQSVHSHFMGYSRLFFIGKGFFWLLNLLISLPLRLFKAEPPQFGAKSAYYVTYLVIEPVITLGLAAVFYFHQKATLTALLLVLATLILFWLAIGKISSARQLYVDRSDGQIFTQAIKKEMLKANDAQMKRQGVRSKTPPLSAHSPLPPVRKAPPVQANHKGISVSDALKKLNPNLKNLDKEDKTE